MRQLGDWVSFNDQSNSTTTLGDRLGDLDYVASVTVWRIIVPQFGRHVGCDGCSSVRSSIDGCLLDGHVKDDGFPVRSSFGG